MKKGKVNIKKMTFPGKEKHKLKAKPGAFGDSVWFGTSSNMQHREYGPSEYVVPYYAPFRRYLWCLTNLYYFKVWRE